MRQSRYILSEKGIPSDGDAKPVAKLVRIDDRPKLRRLMTNDSAEAAGATGLANASRPSPAPPSLP
jgi:hypothetical protein